MVEPAIDPEATVLRLPPRRRRRWALSAADASGRAVLAVPGLAGAAAVTSGVAMQAGAGWAWIVGGLFGLLAGWELNRRGA